jgi:peptidoglycan/xylan/chitin deacetylase (PgdA/CDA1 family)
MNDFGRFMIPKRTKRILGNFVRARLGTITHVRTHEPAAALTYDDGPDPLVTPLILTALEDSRARGTFFMIGAQARQHPDLVRRVHEGGHAIGNHSWDHPSFPRLSSRDRGTQIRSCEDALHPFGTNLFRPPFGDQDLGSRLDTIRFRQRVIAWSIAAEDWLDRDSSLIAETVLSRLQPGSIVLLHDRLYSAIDGRSPDRTHIAEATRLILHNAPRGFRFVTVPELLKLGKPGLERWYQESR